MDILGPFPIASGQRRFVIVAIDYFTKWIEAKALATITSTKCVDFLWNNVICCFGIPKVLVVDNGKQFDNSNFRTFCTNLSIDLRFSFVTHQQSNGQIENMNRSILQGLKKKLDEAKGDGLMNSQRLDKPTQNIMPEQSANISQTFCPNRVMTEHSARAEC
ncbi:hypothetical protein RJ639_019008 [Escallonia herrerae]|uniref:Integrase catalytic domain-containing protein n=1 Tax=Escallonia herrerae TaxID=1293975 RepID=A0AA89AER3_9ASTE|nr:hypothetical protein RJ639_024626 [Escallonia herrerae]KAK3002735.1 hypothetical protein RJ639_019007 [Escallonia herrerae]KAK3002736.1 hypothetical protein RJ639_019008 [Escallonia herrerae]